MREFILLVSDMGKGIIKPLARTTWLLGSQASLFIVGWGILAFILYELSLSSLFNALQIKRNPLVFVLELIVFGLVCACLSCYSRLGLLAARRSSEDSDLAYKGRYETLVRSLDERSARLTTLSQGIEQSLSAVMFFARAHLAKTSNSQLHRDLMEVMERIDQIQLLLREMKLPALSALGNDAREFLRAGKDFQNPNEQSKESGTPYKGANAASPVFSLRKSARKTQILPITVHYTASEARLEFQSYTVNTCESGACIVFSDQGILEDTIIDFQIPSEFQARAVIKWVQPMRTNAFRLAGVEFLDSRTLRTA